MARPFRRRRQTEKTSAMTVMISACEMNLRRLLRCVEEMLNDTPDELLSRLHKMEMFVSESRSMLRELQANVGCVAACETSD